MTTDGPDDPNVSAPKRKRPAQARRKLGSGWVILRFILRMLILLAFASIGAVGFARTLETLLAMATLYCACIATLWREEPFGPNLTNFDEAAAYALCALAVSKAA